MYRELCVLFIFLNYFQDNIKIYCVCSILDQVRSIYKTLRQYFSDVKEFIGTKSSLFAKRKHVIKSILLRFFEEVSTETVSPERLTGTFKANQSSTITSSAYSSTSYPTTTSKQDIFPKMSMVNAIQLIAENGFKAENHDIQADDGYIVTVQRIPTQGVPSTRTIILHHGILGSADDWLLMNKGFALPYLLSEHGYDVWLLNSRGNKYGRAHRNKSLESYAFWDFSWHEIGLYDLSAILKYIKKVTSNADLYYIGHSMGATVLLVLLSIMPEYNTKLKLAIFLAPLAYMSHVKGPLKQLSKFHNHANTLSLIDEMAFMSSKTLPKFITEEFCKGNNITCLNSLMLLTNGGQYTSDLSKIKAVHSRTPVTGSAKTMKHFLQLINSGFFRMFDYGSSINLRKYNQKTPPMYNFEAITVPISIISSTSDSLSTSSDVTTLVSKLKTMHFHHVVNQENFGHMDFLWSNDAPTLIYDHLITFLELITNKI